MEKVEMTLLLLLLGAGALFAQRVETVPFGDFEQWTIREVRESDVVGGKVKTLYDVGPRGKTPWASSNAVAKLAGVTKTSLSSEPDEGPTAPQRRAEQLRKDDGMRDRQRGVSRQRPEDGARRVEGEQVFGCPFRAHGARF